MHVVIVDINEERGKKKADELQGLFIKADVSEVVCNHSVSFPHKPTCHLTVLATSFSRIKWNP